MPDLKSNALRIICALALSLSGALFVVAQKKQAAPTTGSIKGRVRAGGESGAGNVKIILLDGEREVAHAVTNAKGDFEFNDLQPGVYGLTLRKPGLQVGRMDELKVSAGKTVNLKDRLYLAVDEGSIAFLKGSVFSKEGRSFGGARIEVVLVRSDGSEKKINSAVSNSLGAFSFRLPPGAARYRVTAKANGMEASKEVEIDGAAIFRVALELAPAAK
jgi:hypothetical protein